MDAGRWEREGRRRVLPPPEMRMRPAMRQRRRGGEMQVTGEKRKARRAARVAGEKRMREKAPFARVGGCMRGCRLGETAETCVSPQPGWEPRFASVGPGPVGHAGYQTSRKLHGGCEPGATQGTKHAHSSYTRHSSLNFSHNTQMVIYQLHIL